MPQPSQVKCQSSFQNIADRAIQGRIQCRFADQSLEMEELGMLIRERTGHDRNPFFSIQERGSSRPLIQHEIDSDLIYAMTRGRFVMPPVTVQLHNKLSETEMCFSLKPGHSHPISAFPRCLVDDDKGKTRMGLSSTGHTV
jgi:hypothetical protein